MKPKPCRKKNWLLKMMKVFLTCIVICMHASCIAQKISRSSADSLLRIIHEQRGDKSTLFAMLQLSQFYILKTNSGKIDLDSSVALIEDAKRINTRLRIREVEGYIYLQESNLYKKKGAMIPGKALGLQAVEIFKTEKNLTLLGKSFLAVSDFYDYQDPVEVKTRIDWVEKALQCFEKTGDIERQAFCLEALTDLNACENNNVVALEKGMLSLQKYREVPNANTAGIQILLAGLYCTREDLPTALNYCLGAIKNMGSSPDTTGQLAQVYNMTGVIYNQLHKYDTACRYSSDALLISKKLNDTISIHEIASNLAHNLNLIEHYAQAIQLLDDVVTKYGQPKNKGLWGRYLSIYVDNYFALQRFEKAQTYCDIMLPLAKLPGTNVKTSIFIVNQAMNFYLNTRQYEKGRTLSKELIYFMSKVINMNTVGLIFANHCLFRLDTAQHRYQSALDYFLKERSIKDTLLTENKNKEIERLNIEFETTKREKNIELLQKEAQLQNRVIAQSRQTRNYSIAGSLLLLGLLALAINRYKLKQRNNIHLQVKQKEILAKNLQLEKLLHENEWLLKEVHHRVKNNLQIVMSLLNSQSSYLKDEQAVNAVLQSRNRVQAMSLIHQKLYKTDNVSSIYMPEYITDLVDYLKDTMQPNLHVLFNLDIAPIHLDIIKAVPVGLILNEAITNSFKYAFPEMQNPKITVRLTRSPDKELTLYIADNGVGMKTEYNKEINSSFGMFLMYGMVEDLNGKIKMDTGIGIQYTITFTDVDTTERMQVSV